MAMRAASTTRSHSSNAMLSTRNLSARIPILRPLRPPSIASSIRPFTHHTRKLLIASRHTHPRPQLPYLYQHAPINQQTLLGPNQQIARLFSNETRRYVREQVWLATRWTLIIWAFGTLSFITYFGFILEKTERESPTPPEWTFRTRYCLRGLRELMDEAKQANMGQAVDWARVGSFAETVLQRCEDPKLEGKGLELVGQDGEQIIIPGVGNAGFDISAKSWPWRSGYFEAIMTCALAAEHLDGKVFDITNNVVYDNEFVIGPSNPNPRPKTQWMGRVPREEDVVPASDPPETFYMRVLTGKGFTTLQKMDAARAYANWLDFKGLSESADEMYRWALDIAKAGLPANVDPDDIIDTNTGILKMSDPSNDVTPNILRAATDLAIHYARNKDVTAALPIFLSVLRARRAAPVSPFPPLTSTDASRGSDMAATLSGLLHGSRFPPPPASGDNPLVRSTDQPSCEESELMLYIGEILHATSPGSDEGLGWTRQAVTIAEGNLSPSRASAVSNDEMEKKKCKQCIVTGVANWDIMLTRMMESPSTSNRRRNWFKWIRNHANEIQHDYNGQREQLDALKERIARHNLDGQLYAPV